MKIISICSIFFFELDWCVIFDFVVMYFDRSIFCRSIKSSMPMRTKKPSISISKDWNYKWIIIMMVIKELLLYSWMYLLKNICFSQEIWMSCDSSYNPIGDSFDAGYSMDYDQQVPTRSAKGNWRNTSILHYSAITALFSILAGRRPSLERQNTLYDDSTYYGDSTYYNTSSISNVNYMTR